MVAIYANLVEAGYYTTDEEKAVDGVKLVPANLRAQVVEELAKRAEANA